MARFLICLILASLLNGETVVRDVIRSAVGGGAFNGRLVVTAPDLTWQGQTYRRKTTTIQVTNGALYLQLIPTTADPEGFSYRVQYLPADGSAGWVEFWVVPDTTSELKIYQVARASQPSTGASVGLHQIAGARGNSGRALCSDGTIWTSCDLLVNPAFTPGDLLFRGAAGLEALGIGSTPGQVLTVQAGRPAWAGLSLSQIPLLPASQVTSGTLADARIAVSSVTQHQAALSITWPQLTGVPSTFSPSAHAHAATEITSGLLPLARVPSLPASQVTSGTLADARIAASNVTQHQAALSINWPQLLGVPATFTPSAHAHTASEVNSGLFDLARLPSLPASQVTSGTFADARIGASAVTQHQAALSINWPQIASAPAFEAPLSFAGPLVRTGNTVICPTCGGASSGAGSYVKTFSAATSVSIPVAEHGFPNDRLIVDCYDASGGRLEPGSVQVSPGTFSVAVAFSPAQSGSCAVTGQPYAGRTLSQSFSGTSVTIPNVAQEIGTPLFSWRIYGGGNYWLDPDSTSLDAAGNFTVFVSPAVTGRLVIVAR